MTLDSTVIRLIKEADVETAKDLRTEIRQVEKEIDELETRLRLACRRVRGFVNHRDPKRNAWLEDGGDLADLVERLKGIEGDEEGILKLVGEVRDRRKMATEKALQIYAQKEGRLFDR